MRYWYSLQYFVMTLDHLNRMDALGFGIKYKKSRLKQTSSMDMEMISNLQKWIKFEMIFRDANNAIYTTYKLLEMLEMRLHFIRLHSLKMLKSKGDIENIANSMVNSDVNEDYNRLLEIWDMKMNEFSESVPKKFQLYLIEIVEKLQQIHPQMEVFMENRIKRNDYLSTKSEVNDSYVRKLERTENCDSLLDTSKDFTDKFNSSSDNVKNYGNRVCNEYEDVFLMIKSYYKRCEFTEETRDECINRLSDLNNRLLPKFIKTIMKLPLFYEPYLNASVCSLIEDVGFQTSDNINKSVSSQWLTRIRFVRNISKTGLDVIDTIRCAFGGLRNNRKIIVFSQGIIKDLFISSITHHTIKSDENNISYSKHFDLIRNIKQNKSLGIFITDLASDEIDYLIQNDIPSFKWSPPILSNIYDDEEDKQLEIDIDYNKMEESIWKRRLIMFKKINDKHIKNIIRRRNIINNINYGLLLDYNYIPFNVFCDFQNYIPIKYNMKNKINNGSWIISLFNDNNKNKLLKNCSTCINIEIENDLYPAFYLFGNRIINVLIIPIHNDYNFDNRLTFRNLLDISKYKTDLTFPNILYQIKSLKNKIFQNINDKLPLGSFFVTYHTNISLGMLSTNHIDQCNQISISMIFYLVSCDTCITDDITTVNNADNTENIISEMDNIKLILKGLDNIMDICNNLKVSSLIIPASLKCCYKINDKIIPDFNLKTSNYHLLEPNHDYIRCLAVISHLATRFNKINDIITYINIIFPFHLKETLLPKTASSIFSNHVDVF